MKARPSIDLVLCYLQTKLGMWVPHARLRDVAEIDDIGRAIRRLTADGWVIENGKGRVRLKNAPRGVPRGDGKTVSGSMRVRILERDGGRCKLCGIAAGEMHPRDGKPARLEVDHIIPRHFGGPTTPENLRALCHVCNHDKQHRTDLIAVGDAQELVDAMASFLEQLPLFGGEPVT